VTVVRASLCRDLQTRGNPDWQCVAAGEQVPAGRVFFYTRLAAARSTTVEHHWYRNDTLRQRVPLRITPSPGSGYRTYSRTTATAGTWRVELRGSDGEVLHQERFVVR
jgi:hypothetical protein